MNIKLLPTIIQNWVLNKNYFRFHYLKEIVEILKVPSIVNLAAPKK